MIIFDADIHQTFVNQEALYPYLSDRYVDRIRKNGLGYPRSPYFSIAGYKRKDAVPENGVAGSDIDFLRKHLFEDMGVSYGVLNGSGILGVSQMLEIEYPHHLAYAYNKWLIDAWLDKEPRFYGSMHIAIQNPDAAVEMIREIGAHPKIVQVLLPVIIPLEISHPAYRPVLKAIAEMGLTLAFHIWQPAVSTGNMTAMGNPNLYYSYRSQIASSNVTQMHSLILDGVFEEIPELKCVFVEGGYSWLVYFKNRLKQLYPSLRAEVPWLTHDPSYYIENNCRFTCQPVEELNPIYRDAILKDISAQDILLYSSDYPHWDADNPSHAMKHLPAEFHENIMGKNALKLYGIDHEG